MNERKELDRAGIVNRLAALREIWEVSAGDLIETEASVGLLLADFVSTLGLEQSERLEIFGTSLLRQIEIASQECGHNLETL